MKRTALALAAIFILASPAVAAQQAQYQPVYVMFTAGSDEVTNMGKAQLEAFAREFRTHKDKSITISGHATLAESEENSAAFAVGFSQRRANNVRDYLTALGVPSGVMLTQAFGSSRPVEGSSPNASRNQRVEVVISEGSGW